MFVSIFKKQAENLASDLLHLIPTGILNALLERDLSNVPRHTFPNTNWTNRWNHCGICGVIIWSIPKK